MSEQTVVVSGATGNLGGRIVKALLARKAKVIALTRHGSAPEKVAQLRTLGAEVKIVDPLNVTEIAAACSGASCVVSSLLGLKETLVDAQTVLLNGAVNAGVPRFIPSDYSLDFSQLRPGENRNLDLHVEFQTILAKAPIASTSILNGAFMELLVGPAPFLVFPIRRALYWGNPDQVLDFTAMDDVAAFTAAASMDSQAPKVLKISGQRVTARQLASIASDVTGKPFKVQWAGTLGMLAGMIKVMRAVMPENNDPFPPWQGMQYSHNMFSGRGVLEPLANDRYPGISWTQIRTVLASR